MFFNGALSGQSTLACNPFRDDILDFHGRLRPVKTLMWVIYILFLWSYIAGLTALGEGKQRIQENNGAPKACFQSQIIAEMAIYQLVVRNPMWTNRI